MPKEKLERQAPDESGSETVGNRNEEALSMREKIAQSSEEYRTRPTDDGSPHETFEEEEETAADNQNEQAEVEDDDDSEDLDSDAVDEADPGDEAKGKPEKFKIKVRGKEIELTHDELIARAQKVENADQYMQEAAEALKKISNPPSDKVEKTESDEDDDVALARALQMGTEEDAARVIKKLRTPPVNSGELSQVFDERYAFLKASEWVQDEYPELFADEDIRQLFLMKDSQMVQGGDKRPYATRYKEIGDALRTKFGKTHQEKLERKRKNVVDIKQASGRKTEVVEDEHEPTPSEIIANMAKSRGQPSNR